MRERVLAVNTALVRVGRSIPAPRAKPAKHAKESAIGKAETRTGFSESIPLGVLGGLGASPLRSP